jgi:hypothetical protein
MRKACCSAHVLFVCLSPGRAGRRRRAAAQDWAAAQEPQPHVVHAAAGALRAAMCSHRPRTLACEVPGACSAKHVQPPHAAQATARVASCCL